MPTTIKKTTSKDSHRLSRFVKPNRYQISIQPDFGTFTFTGSEKIKLDVLKSTKELTLHSADLKIFEVRLISKHLNLKPTSISYQQRSETVTFKFSKSIVGQVNLQLNFSGTLTDQLRGFYRSKYVHNDTEKYLATTQFEATDARRAFPCFDEPAHKAVFDVSLIVENSHQVISNTLETKITAHDPGFKVVKFAPTPKMSTYLLAYIIGELESVSTKTKRGTLVRVHTTPGKKHLTKFSLDVAKRSLEYLESYFAINYPLPALDLIAIPDFSAAAMENWGAITFRETALLVDEQHTAFINRQRIAEVIAHELVHQWFGNLVTMKWWTHLWLNESFASFMAYHVVDQLFPEWNFWTKFALNEQSYALRADSLHSTHPIEVEVKHPDEISEIFDGISYAKGASILKMIAAYVGEDNFRDSLRLYLKKHSYKNTHGVDLWNAFESVSKKPIPKLIKNWLLKPGFPVVSIAEQNSYVSLSQERFTLLPQRKPDTSTWQIPIAEQFKKAEVGETRIFATKSRKYKINKHFQFIKLNPGETGFYITNYSAELLSKLVSAVNNQDFSSIDRVAIVRNLFLLSKAGKISTDVYLDYINSIYLEENSYIVWSEIANQLSELNHLVYGTTVQKPFNQFKLKLFTHLLSKVGTTEDHHESHQVKLLRGLVFVQGGLISQPKVVKESKKLFKLYKNGSAIKPDLRSGVLFSIAKHGDLKTFNQLVGLYKNKELQEERNQILMALFRFKQSSIQNKLVKFLYSGQVRNQDLPFALRVGISLPQTRNIIWNSVTNNYAVLKDQFGQSRLLGRIFEGASSCNTNQELSRFLQLTKKDKKQSKQSITQTIENIKINISWKKRDLTKIKKFLKNQ